MESLRKILEKEKAMLRVLRIKVMCSGRDAERKEVLGTPLSVDVLVHYEDPNSVVLRPECPHLIGFPRFKCTASGHRDSEVPCAYAAAVPVLVEMNCALRAQTKS